MVPVPQVLKVPLLRQLSLVSSRQVRLVNSLPSAKKMLSRTTVPSSPTAPKTVQYRPSSDPSSLPVIALHYFAVEGRCESSRLAAFYSGLSFDDVRYTRPEFMSLKTSNSLPFGQFPMAILPAENVTFPQSASILRAVGKLSPRRSLYPSSDIGASGLIDAVLDLDGDAFLGVSVTAYKERFGFDFLNERPDLVAEVRTNLRDRILPVHLANLERTITAGEGGGGRWLAGRGEVSVADFAWCPRLKWMKTLDGIGPDILNDFPKLVDLMERFYAIPEVVEYYSLQKRDEDAGM